jgi:hypothetical protein
VDDYRWRRARSLGIGLEGGSCTDNTLLRPSDYIQPSASSKLDRWAPHKCTSPRCPLCRKEWSSAVAERGWSAWRRNGKEEFTRRTWRLDPFIGTAQGQLPTALSPGVGREAASRCEGTAPRADSGWDPRRACAAILLQGTRDFHAFFLRLHSSARRAN